MAVLGLYSSQVGQGCLDNGRVFDAGDNLDRPHAVLTGLESMLKTRFRRCAEADGGVTLGGDLVRLLAIAFAASGRGDLRALGAVGREYAVIAGEMHPRLRNKSRQPDDEGFRASCPPPLRGQPTAVQNCSRQFCPAARTRCG